MLFSSLSFIFRFLPIFLIIYFITPHKGKNFVLLVGSLVFYALGEPIYVFLMLLSILVNYLIARFIAHNKDADNLKLAGLILAIIYNVGLLLFFKYSAFFADIIQDISGVKPWEFSFALPLGISFYTFQILSYVADVYEDADTLEKNIIDLGAYVTMFPQLIAGPIVVYKDVREHIKSPGARVHFAAVDEGFRIFTIGLASKVLIANRLGQIWDTMDQIGYAYLATDVAWIGVIAYTLQIYFDFNGYSLMAIGLGRILGFTFPENFNHPYCASSVTDFWKRWHISLTSFFRKYIYIPLGGNRKGAFATYRNMFIVWLITGFWHGADWNFIIWGLYYFVLLSIERLLVGKEGLLFKIKPIAFLYSKKVSRFIFSLFGHVYAIFAVVVGWAIFAITDLWGLVAYLERMFAPVFNLPTAGMGMESLSDMMFGWIIAGCILSTPLFMWIYKKIKDNIISAFILLVLFWACVVQLVDSAYNPFLYFRF